jgi:hypothetical protein
MARLLFRPQRGRPPLPRVAFTPAFLDHLRRSERPGRRLSAAGGWRNYSAFSALIHQRAVRAHPITIERFYRLADALKFPRADVFEASR